MIRGKTLLRISLLYLAMPLSFISHRTTAGRLRRPPIVVQQDGASSHRSASTLRFLRRNWVNLLPEWPANLPDCNQVEHCWAWLAHQLVGRPFRTEGDLETWRMEPESSHPDAQSVWFHGAALDQCGCGPWGYDTLLDAHFAATFHRSAQCVEFLWPPTSSLPSDSGFSASEEKTIFGDR